LINQLRSKAKVDRKIEGRTISNYAKKSVQGGKKWNLCKKKKEILVYNTTDEKHHKKQ